MGGKTLKKGHFGIGRGIFSKKKLLYLKEWKITDFYSKGGLKYEGFYGKHSEYISQTSAQ